jgi:hypothetical protein
MEFEGKFYFWIVLPDDVWFLYYQHEYFWQVFLWYVYNSQQTVCVFCVLWVKSQFECLSFHSKFVTHKSWQFYTQLFRHNWDRFQGCVFNFKFTKRSSSLLNLFLVVWAAFVSVWYVMCCMLWCVGSWEVEVGRLKNWREQKSLVVNVCSLHLKLCKKTIDFVWLFIVFLIGLLYFRYNQKWEDKLIVSCHFKTVFIGTNQNR